MAAPISVALAPVKVSQRTARPYLITNNSGLVSVYLGQDANITPLNYAVLLAPGQSITWNEINSDVWAVANSSTAAQLTIAYQASATFSPNVNITNATIPVSGTINANITNASIPVTGTVAVSSGTVSISGTPSVTVTSGSVNVANTPSVTLTGTTNNVNVSNTPNVAVTNTPTVGISGSANTVALASGTTVNATVSGSVSVSNTPAVTISGTGNTVQLATGTTVNVGNTPAVTLSGSTNNVNVSNTPTVNISAVNNSVQIANTPSVTVSSGTVSIGNTPAVTVNSGTVNATITNASIPVTGNVGITSGSVSISSGSVSVSSGNITAANPNTPTLIQTYTPTINVDTNFGPIDVSAYASLIIVPIVNTTVAATTQQTLANGSYTRVLGQFYDTAQYTGAGLTRGSIYALWPFKDGLATSTGKATSLQQALQVPVTQKYVSFNLYGKTSGTPGTQSVSFYIYGSQENITADKYWNYTPFSGNTGTAAYEAGYIIQDAPTASPATYVLSNQNGDATISLRNSSATTTALYYTLSAYNETTVGVLASNIFAGNAVTNYAVGTAVVDTIKLPNLPVTLSVTQTGSLTCRIGVTQ